MKYIFEYSENTARRYLSQENTDKCIIYCLRCIPQFLSIRGQYAWFFTPDTEEDIKQDMSIVIMDCVRRFDEKHQSSLMNWIYVKLDYYFIEKRRAYYIDKVACNTCQYDEYFDIIAEPERNWDEPDTRVCKTCKKELKLNKFYKGRIECFNCKNARKPKTNRSNDE